MNHQQTTELTDWLRAGSRGTLYRFVTALVALALAAELVASTTDVPRTARLVSDYLTRGLALLGPLLFVVLSPLPHTKLSGDAASCATRFATTWRHCLMLWIGMGLFYFASHICRSQEMLYTHWASVLVIPLHAFRNALALLIARAHYELAMKSVVYNKGRIGTPPDNALILSCVILLAGVDLYLRFDDVVAIIAPENQAIVQQMYTGWFERDPARLRFDVICWVIYAAILLVFAARFQSRLIDISPQALLPVYGACALQPFAALGENAGVLENLSQFAFVLTAAGTILLFAIVHWFIQDRTPYYFTSLRETHYRVRLDRSAFRQVQAPAGLDDGVYMALALAPLTADTARQNRVKKLAARIRDHITESTRMPVFCPAVHDHHPDDAVARRENFYRIRHCRVFVLIYDEPGATGSLIELGVALSHYRPTIICHRGEALPALARRSPGSSLLEHLPLLGTAKQTCRKLIPAILRMNEIADQLARDVVAAEFAAPARSLPRAADSVRIAAAPAPPADERRLDILVMTSSDPRNRTALDVEAEVRDVERELAMVEHRDLVRLWHTPAVRPDDLVRRLGAPADRPTALHFSGHGEYGGIVFRGEGGGEHRLHGAILRNILKDRGVRLVVLNACFTYEHAAQLADVVDVVIGTKTEVDDSVSRAFSVAFYRTLGNGLPVGRAYRDGVDAAAAVMRFSTEVDDSLRKDAAYGIYYLFGDGKLVLVDAALILAQDADAR